MLAANLFSSSSSSSSSSSNGSEGGRSRTTTRTRTICQHSLLLLALVALLTRANAADHNNLDEGLPTQLSDAYPIEYYGREIQTSLSYERTAEGEDLFVVEPRLELGFAPNWQGTLHVPFEFGSGAAEGISALGVEALYNFNTEGIWLPGFALSGRADFPTGPATHGIDTTAKFILTKSIGRTSFLNQLHLNVAWLHNDDPQRGERDNRYQLVAGWSARLDADTIGIIDYVREQELERGITSDIIEVGLRRQITPRLVLSAGVGAGVSDDSPKFRATLGLQRSF